MNLQKIYTALLTADLAAAEGWYTKLLVVAKDGASGSLVEASVVPACRSRKLQLPVTFST